MTANPVPVRVDALPSPYCPQAGCAPAAGIHADRRRHRRSAGGLVLLLALGGCAGTGVPPASDGATPDMAASRPPAVAAPSRAGLPAMPAAAAPSANTSPAADLSLLRPAIRTHYRELQASGGQLYQLDPARSELRIYAFRAGLAARLGHNHILAVQRFSGLAWAPAKGLRGASADVGFRLRELQVDPPALRAETGGGFASPLDPEAVQGTLDHLLSEQGFDAASHPWIEVSATVETGEAPLAVADFALSLHGETHHQRVPLRVQVDERHLEVSGTLAFRQGDYGIKPYAVMGGLLAVDDLVVVEFHLRGLPLAAAVP